MTKKNEVIDTLEYRGYHVDFYNDDFGQQVYTYFDGEEIGFGTYNFNYKDDMKYIIDNKLDVISNFSELQDEGIYGAQARWFINSGYDDIQVIYKGRIIYIILVGDRENKDGKAYLKQHEETIKMLLKIQLLERRLTRLEKDLIKE